ncbi:MAG TPA: hypothetical protein PKV56_11860 [Burkholderiaceae bacterium]|nr:hypothetical protein [Burkholderiaceae bacterium]
MDTNRVPGWTLLRATRPRLLSVPLLLLATLLGLSRPASALDGCMVMLCLAAPSWREIPMCVPTMHDLNKHLARGRRFPTCADAGAGNTAGNEWASAPDFCPPQYTRRIDGESGSTYTCDFMGAVTVNVNGQPFTRTWWNAAGDTVTEFSAAAKAQLGTWDTKFDDDYAAWFAALPPPAPVVESGY